MHVSFVHRLCERGTDSWYIETEEYTDDLSLPAAQLAA